MAVWAQVLVAVATPVLAFVGAVVGHRAHRRSAIELDTWRRREETFRTLRWAAEQITVDNPGSRAIAGVVLGELLDSELLQNEDVQMTQAVLEAAAQLDDNQPMTYYAGESSSAGSVDGNDDDG